MLRIPYPVSPEASSNGGGPNGEVLNIQRMLKHLPTDILQALEGLLAAVLWKGSVPPALRELAIVRLGNLSDSAYELQHHEPFARHLGVTQEKIDKLKQSEISSVFSPAERAVLEFVDELATNARPSDAALNNLQRHFSAPEILELVVAVGCYMTVCRVLETTGIECDTFSLDPAGPADQN